MALALEQVGSVDGAGGDLDEDLAGAGGRVGHLLPGQDLGSTGLGDHDGVHGPQQ
jgi:hypothetical protein